MTDYPFEEKYALYGSWYKPRNPVTERMTHKLAKAWVEWISTFEPSTEHKLAEFVSTLTEEQGNFLTNYILSEPSILIPLSLEFDVIINGDTIERLMEQPPEISHL